MKVLKGIFLIAIFWPSLILATYIDVATLKGWRTPKELDVPLLKSFGYCNFVFVPIVYAYFIVKLLV